MCPAVKSNSRTLHHQGQQAHDRADILLKIKLAGRDFLEGRVQVLANLAISAFSSVRLWVYVPRAFGLMLEAQWLPGDWKSYP